MHFVIDFMLGNIHREGIFGGEMSNVLG